MGLVATMMNRHRIRAAVEEREKYNGMVIRVVELTHRRFSNQRSPVPKETSESPGVIDGPQMMTMIPHIPVLFH